MAPTLWLRWPAAREAAARRAARLLRGRRPGRADGRARARAVRRARSTCARRSSTTSTWSSSCASAARCSSSPRQEVPEGATVVFSAHGVAPSVHANAARRAPADDRRHLPAGDQGPRRGQEVRRRGLHDRADRPRRARGGRGDDGGGARAHRADRERARTSTRSRSRIPSKVAYISQTTLSVDETRAIIDRLRERFPAIVGPRTDDICYATTNRQAAVKQLARECDLVLVIGSRNSSNSNRLVEVAREHGADSYLIDNEAQVRERVAGRQAGRRHHLGRERARGARAAPRRVLPRPRDERRPGARGGPGGRPLHAPQGDPPGDGGRRVA